MIGRKRRSRGFGQAVSQSTIDWLTFPNPPTPVAVPGPSTELQMTGAASWTPEQAIAAWSDAQKKQTLEFFKNVTGLPNISLPGSGPPTPPDCTNTWTYYTNSACPPDCSRFFTNLFNATCPGLGIGSKLTWTLAIAAGVLLLVVVIRR